MGPRSLEVLRKLDPSLAPDTSLRYGKVVNAKIDGIDVIALRVSYVGEKGYELHVKAADTVALYQADNVRMNIRPVQQPRPPVWIAANNDAAIKRAAPEGVELELAAAGPAVRSWATVFV